METLIITQAQAQVEELLKIASQGREGFPDRPGKKFTGRFFGDALALSLAAALGAGGTHLLARKLTPKGGFIMSDKARTLIRTLGPAVAAGGSVAALETAKHLRGRRLAEAMQMDAKDRRKKALEAQKAK